MEPGSLVFIRMNLHKPGRPSIHRGEQGTMVEHDGTQSVVKFAIGKQRILLNCLEPHPSCAAVPATHSWMPPNMLLSSSEIGQLPSVTLSQKIPDSKMSADDEAVPPLIEQQLDPAVAAVVASADTITEVPPGYMLDQDGVFCFRPHPGSATQLRAPDTDEVSDDSDGNIVPTSLPPLCDSSSENEVGGPVPANEEDSSEDSSGSDLVVVTAAVVVVTAVAAP